jgi:ubiquinone/menaquinone biosynthesis C-methylase UbiE
VTLESNQSIYHLLLNGDACRGPTGAVFSGQLPPPGANQARHRYAFGIICWAKMMNTPFPSTSFADAWIQIDRTADPGFFVRLLDATRARLLERARRSPTQFFKALDPRPGLHLLDVGCGTGDFLRLLAPILAPGNCVGVDLSETMITEACRRSDAGTPNISFRVGSVQELPFANGSFDRVIATQLLLHVLDPWRGLAEMCRVLAPGGLISITEIDWGTLVVECTDRELGRRFTQLACDEFRNPLIVREIPWRLRDLGFQRIQITPEVEVSQDLDAFHRWFIEPSMSHFTKIGAFSGAEADSFLGDLKEREREGKYFCSRSYYSVIASRPD